MLTDNRLSRDSISGFGGVIGFLMSLPITILLTSDPDLITSASGVITVAIPTGASLKDSIIVKMEIIKLLQVLDHTKVKDLCARKE